VIEEDHCDVKVSTDGEERQLSVNILYPLNTEYGQPVEKDDGEDDSSSNSDSSDGDGGEPE
jgi:hypothetical protein